MRASLATKECRSLITIKLPCNACSIWGGHLRIMIKRLNFSRSFSCASWGRQASVVESKCSVMSYSRCILGAEQDGFSSRVRKWRAPMGVMQLFRSLYTEEHLPLAPLSSSMMLSCLSEWLASTMRSEQFSNAGSAMRCTKCGLCSCTKFSKYVSACVANSYDVNWASECDWTSDCVNPEPKNRVMISR